MLLKRAMPAIRKEKRGRAKGKAKHTLPICCPVELWKLSVPSQQPTASESSPPAAEPGAGLYESDQIDRYRAATLEYLRMRKRSE